MKNWGNRFPKFNNWKIHILRVISGELKKSLKFDLMHFRSSEMVLMKTGKPLEKIKQLQCKVEHGGAVQVEAMSTSFSP